MDALVETEAYRAALDQAGGTPAELFDDFVEQLGRSEPLAAHDEQGLWNCVEETNELRKSLGMAPLKE